MLGGVKKASKANRTVTCGCSDQSITCRNNAAYELSSLETECSIGSSGNRTCDSQLIIYKQ